MSDFRLENRDVTTGKCKLRPLRWRVESAPLGLDRVRVSENLGATAVAPIAPVVTSLEKKTIHFKNSYTLFSQKSESYHFLKNCNFAEVTINMTIS